MTTAKHFQTAYERKVLQSFAKWNNGEYVETEMHDRIYSGVEIAHENSTVYITFSHEFGRFFIDSDAQHLKMLTNDEVKTAISRWRQTKKLPAMITN